MGTPRLQSGMPEQQGEAEEEAETQMSVENLYEKKR
jgi:hypothetical protein